MPDELYRRLDERLHGVETQVSLILSSLKAELGGNGTPGNIPRLLNTLHEELHEVREHLLGRLDHPGLVMRLDRLEIAEQRRARLLSALLVTLISLVVKAGWDLLTG